MNVADVIKENKKRKAKLFGEYNPITGEGSTVPRVHYTYSAKGIEKTFLAPLPMVRNPMWMALRSVGSIEKLLSEMNMPVTVANVDFLESQLLEVRFDYDFEFWAFTTVKIQDKESKKAIPFKLNYGQRKLLRELEDMRVSGIPIRIVLLKARQWGGSTLVQIYMAWIQIRLRTNWHSAVVADVEEQAKNIRGMYSRLAKEYITPLSFSPFEGSSKTRILDQRGCIIGIGSAQKPDSLRSFDFAMLHQSEVGLWKSTKSRSAEDLAQSLQATVPDVPDSMVVQESTAKGQGNYLHRQWLAAKKQSSKFRAVFVSWFEIERYTEEVPNMEEFISSWDEYQWSQWNDGATVEGIYWYHTTKEGYDYDDWRMKSEYPGNDVEAFQTSGTRVFRESYVQNARKTCRKPIAIGNLPSINNADGLKNIEFTENSKGDVKIWAFPDKSENVSNRYLVSLDIGGKTDGADWSVIKVFDRYWMAEEGVPEVVAKCKFHADQDLTVWRAVQMAAWYNNALFVPEANSLKKDNPGGDYFLTILDEIVEFYGNIYARNEDQIEKLRSNIPLKYGFHTNTATKKLIITFLNKALRETLYIERDDEACDEMAFYEEKADGSYGAVEGQHDDEVMTTAIGVYICHKMPLPTIHSKREDRAIVRQPKSASTF